MTSYRFEYITTGGGCSAIMVSGERYHALITAHDECDAPDGRTEFVDVGYYAGAVPEGHEAFYFEELERYEKAKIEVPILIEALDAFGAISPAAAFSATCLGLNNLRAAGTITTEVKEK